MIPAEIRDIVMGVKALVHRVLAGVDYQHDLDEVEKELRRKAMAAEEAIHGLLERLEHKERAAERYAERVERDRQANAARMVSANIGDSFDPHGYYVYLLWGADPDKPLYVGQSSNILSRLGSHMSRRGKRHMTQQSGHPLQRQGTMDRTEWQLIRRYQPPWNTDRIDRGDDARLTGAAAA